MMTSASISNLPTLRQGSTGPAVLELQRLLVKTGFWTPSWWGVIEPNVDGPLTNAAVVQFQRSRMGFAFSALSGRGVVDAATWTALYTAAGEYSARGGFVSRAAPTMRGFSGALTTAVRAAGSSYDVAAALAKPTPNVGESMFDFEARQQAWESAEMNAGRIPMYVSGVLAPPSPEMIAMKKRTRWDGAKWVDPQSTAGVVVTNSGAMTGRTKLFIGAFGLGALYFFFKKR